MACYKPMVAFQGVSGIKFKPAPGHVPIELPCGGCIGCKIQRSREWSIRCMHEASQHTENTFLTLTYNDSHLPKDSSLKYEDFQGFMKRLRYRAKNEQKYKLRFYMCGEYGELGRPHYHAIIFGYKYADETLWKNRRGNQTYRSKNLEQDWPFGFTETGNVTSQSAAYVARYIVKKQKKEIQNKLRTVVDEQTGELIRQKDEFTQMSLKPGIGKPYYDKHKADIFPGDTIILEGGKKAPVPKYYRGLLKKEDPETAEKLREKRVEKAQLNTNNTEDRLKVREAIQRRKLKKLKREL